MCGKWDMLSLARDQEWHTVFLLSFQICLESFVSLLNESTGRPGRGSRVVCPGHMWGGGASSGLELRLTNTGVLGIVKTWFLLSHASTDPLINASWWLCPSHKGVGWKRQFNVILGGKDQHKKLCDSNRPGLYLEKQRDSSILGHQRQPCFCAKV